MPAFFVGQGYTQANILFCQIAGQFNIHSV